MSSWLRTARRRGAPRIPGTLRLEAVSKAYGDLAAVDGVSFDVEPGSFLTLLGPSGSGKTTTLRLIAGFLRPDSGDVIVGGNVVTTLPPYKRDIGMVFQNYALFPHMTAAENIAFPLQMRRTPRHESRRRIDEIMRLVELEGLGDRFPRQLSGGQQQRVSLARALVFRPLLLLMDEPLGALDKKLREALQIEIVRIGRQLGVTIVYVTHDQDEALAMSDTIAVYNRGRIEQLGTGEELYERPASLFVATFIGDSNVLHGRLEVTGSTPEFVQGSRRLPLDEDLWRASRLGHGSAAAIVIRPERVNVRPAQDPGADTAGSLGGIIRDVVYLGAVRKYLIDLDDGSPLTASVHIGDAHVPLGADERVCVSWNLEAGIVVADADLSNEDADVVGESDPLERATVVGAQGES